MSNNTTPNSPLISIKDLVIDFHTRRDSIRAVDSISLDIPKGKTMGLVGESGSGKSVTAMSILRLLPEPPARVQGQILFEGNDLLKLSGGAMRKIRGNRISMIFQEPMTSLNPVFTIGNQICETLRLHQHLSHAQARERAIDLLNQVKVPDPTRRFDSYPHELSGGQKQRAMIAMAMACEPDLLIADEPTTALDVTVQAQVLDLMLGLQEKHKMSLLFITHDLGVIGDIADDVAVMQKGVIVEQGTTREIFQNPRHPYTQGLWACRPRVGTFPKRLLTISDFIADHGVKRPEAPTEKTQKPLTETVLSIRDVKKHFPITSGIFQGVKGWVKAVDGVSFDVQKGKTLGLVGESGCGKTTLGRTILRLIEPTAGQILYKGQDLATLGAEALRKMRSKIQIIFQDPYSSLNPRLMISEALTEPMEIHGIGSSATDRLERAAALLQKVGLKPEHLNRYPHEFSGGQRQRICIARALSVNPEFLICDESVSALDVSVQAQILNLLLDLQEEFGLTYVFISHDLGVVNFISDEVAVMYDGKIVEMGDAQSLYRAPKNDYTRKLLAAIPQGTKKALAAVARQ